LSKISLLLFRPRVETSTLKGHRHKMFVQDIWLPPFEDSSSDRGLKFRPILRSEISNLRSPGTDRRDSSPGAGGGEGIRTPDPRVANAVLCQLSYTPDSNFRLWISDYGFDNPKSAFCNPQSKGWLRGRDLNPRPLGYEPNELPDCSTPRQELTISNLRSQI
jgi:hypothetical protein